MVIRSLEYVRLEVPEDELSKLTGRKTAEDKRKPKGIKCGSQKVSRCLRGALGTLDRFDGDMRITFPWHIRPSEWFSKKNPELPVFLTVNRSSVQLYFLDGCFDFQNESIQGHRV
jgi:hypothetical protein